MRKIIQDLRTAAGRISALAGLLNRGGMVTQEKEAREISALILGCVDRLGAQQEDKPPESSLPLDEFEAPPEEPPTPEDSRPVPPGLTADGQIPTPAPLVEEESVPIVTYPNCQCGHPHGRHHAGGCGDDCECKEFTVPETSLQGPSTPAPTDTKELL